MNLASMRSVVRDILTAGGGVNTNINNDTFWVDKEINYYVNNAYRQLYRVLRMTRADWFQRIMNSTDASLVILGRTFDPSTLKTVSGTGNYTLPPDFVAMKLLTDLSTSPIRFTACDLTKERMRTIINDTANTGISEYYYDIIGLKTLIIRPIPQDARDIQLIYDKNIGHLTEYTTGTILSLTGTQFTCVGTALLANVSAGDEFMIGTGTTAPTADGSVDYPVIKSVDSDTTFTIDGPWLGPAVAAAAIPFIIAQTPEVPAAYQDGIIHLAVKLAASKGPNPHVELAGFHGAEADRIMRQVMDDLEIREMSDPVTSDAYLEGDVD